MFTRDKPYFSTISRTQHHAGTHQDYCRQPGKAPPPTTVPVGMVRQLGLGTGNILEWQLAVKGGMMIIEVAPAK